MIIAALHYLRFLALAIPLILVSCSGSDTRYINTIASAEKVMAVDADSALSVLESIGPSDLKEDSIKAKYHYLKAYGHMKANRSMIGDSLISFVHD